jgi:FKBP-type peptidyl-prolyl cis-trans isomerase FkpA
MEHFRFKTDFFLMICLSCVFFILSCSKENEWTTAESGVEYKFIERNKNGKQPKLHDVLKMDISYKNQKDSVLYEGDIKIRLELPSHPGGSIEEALIMMHEGDSARFKIDLRSFYSFTLNKRVDFPTAEGEKLTFDVRLREVLSPEEAEQEKEELLKKMKADETILLESYLEQNSIDEEPLMSGLYYIEKEAGTGKSPEPGDRITVHYEGQLINGQVFDSSLKRDEPFTFVYGRGNVIRGWEEGLARMKEGGKARLIIPSHLAYGKKGAMPRIKPYSTLIFDLELLNVE